MMRTLAAPAIGALSALGFAACSPPSPASVPAPEVIVPAGAESAAPTSAPPASESAAPPETASAATPAPPSAVASASPPAGKACVSSKDCGPKETCSGEAGCDATWVCVAARPCTRDLAKFCGCDGKTVSGSSSCPPAKYKARGACSP